MFSIRNSILPFIFFLFTSYSFSQKKQEIDYVNSYIGTAEKGEGGLALSVGPPFTMTNFSPQTCENIISRMYYVYEDTSILGFIASHQPTVWMGDYGYVSVMPEIGTLKLKPEDRKLSFSHKDEIASPYYYSVKMKTEEKKIIKAEIAATERCGIFKFTFPKSKNSHLVFQSINIEDKKDEDGINSKENRANKLTAFIKFDKAKNQIIGYNPDRASFDIGPELKNFKGYFVIQFDKPYDAFGTWNNDKAFPSSEELAAKKRLGAYVSFSTKENEVVKVKIATSFISIEQAEENLSREIPDWDFDKTASQTKKAWQSNLEKIKIDGVDEEKKKIFYTAYYHTLLFPRQFSEYGKYYSPFDDKIHEGISYTDYSLWDTFRALHPFLLFVQPDRVNDMITSMLNIYKEGGRLPMWPNPAESNIMIGTHADAVIADAYVKGVRGYDTKLAYEAMRKDAMIATDCDGEKNKMLDRQNWGCYEGQAGLQFFHTLGYIPSDYKSESVARTIEYGIDDYCVAQVAKDMNKKDDFEKLTVWS
ncbi:MAG TPA: GH92 family glycosyl hydrolase, partial [Flavobacterium sp.]|uniref:GH92 family glycosyl hydrolase n=1 Tax=Flavobacterium sp. TaxID=239 RepID=UPI002DBE4D06